jgi:regulator of cell morphogenesis and NO signaling
MTFRRGLKLSTAFLLSGKAVVFYNFVKRLKIQIMHQSNKIFIVSEMKTSDIIISNPYLILVLEHLGINMEVQEKTVGQICSENRVSTELFLMLANLFNGYKSSPGNDYSFDDIQTIIKYLKNCHRYYLEEKYPMIQDYIEMINRVNDNSEIPMIGKFFDKYFTEVTEHLDYEDDIVFPYILHLNNQLTHGSSGVTVTNYSVTEYREHHNDIEEKLTDLNNLLIKYMPQKNDQQVRRKLLLCLFELEYDLKIHSQIEETILIPMVEKMEQLAKNRK